MASVALEKASKEELVAGFKRLAKFRDNAKQEAQRVAEQAVHTAATLTGGAVSGVLQAKYPELGDTGVPTDALLSGGVLLAVMLGVTGKYESALNSFASGLGAAALARETHKMLTK